MAVVLLIDMLGSREKWQTGGLEAAKAAFDRFSRIVVDAARQEPVRSVIGGGIETDSAVLICAEAPAALRIAQRMFLCALDSQRGGAGERLWLRGSLTTHKGDRTIRHSSPVDSPLQALRVFTYHEQVFDAISIEKSGFKGMRLLVRDELVDQRTQDAFRIPFGKRTFIPFRRLRHSTYPHVVGGDLQDFLWMASGDDVEWRKRALQMADLLRFAASSPEEFAHAAATQVVFHEVQAMQQSMQSRANRVARRNEKKGKGGKTKASSEGGTRPADRHAPRSG
jgi:hypothetical protein